MITVSLLNKDIKLSKNKEKGHMSVQSNNEIIIEILNYFFLMIKPYPSIYIIILIHNCFIYIIHSFIENESINTSIFITHILISIILYSCSFFIKSLFFKDLLNRFISTHYLNWSSNYFSGFINQFNNSVLTIKEVDLVNWNKVVNHYENDFGSSIHNENAHCDMTEDNINKVNKAKEILGTPPDINETNIETNKDTIDLKHKESDDCDDIEYLNGQLYTNIIFNKNFGKDIKLKYVNKNSQKNPNNTVASKANSTNNNNFNSNNDNHSDEVNFQSVNSFLKLFYYTKPMIMIPNKIDSASNNIIKSKFKLSKSNPSLNSINKCNLNKAIRNKINQHLNSNIESSNFYHLGEFMFNKKDLLIKRINKDQKNSPSIYNTNDLDFKKKNNCSTIEDEMLFFEVSIRVTFILEKIINVDLVFIDITQLKFSQAKETELELKGKMFSKVAHEFKTPLITITSELEVLNDKIDLLVKNIEDESADSSNKLSSLFNTYSKQTFFNEISEIRKISTNINYLSHYTNFLILDIIQYSNKKTINTNTSMDSQGTKKMSSLNIRRILIPNFKLEVVNFNYQILNSLLQYSTGNKQNIKPLLIYDIEIDNCIICSDKLRLNQVLLNFISNAVKFTKKGSIGIVCYLMNNEVDNSKKKNSNNDLLNFLSNKNTENQDGSNKDINDSTAVLNSKVEKKKDKKNSNLKLKLNDINNNNNETKTNNFSTNNITYINACDNSIGTTALMNNNNNQKRFESNATTKSLNPPINEKNTNTNVLDNNKNTTGTICFYTQLETLIFNMYNPNKKLRNNNVNNITPINKASLIKLLSVSTINSMNTSNTALTNTIKNTRKRFSDTMTVYSLNDIQKNSRKKQLRTNTTLDSVREAKLSETENNIDFDKHQKDNLNTGGAKFSIETDESNTPEKLYKTIPDYNQVSTKSSRGINHNCLFNNSLYLLSENEIIINKRKEKRRKTSNKSICQEKIKNKSSSKSNASIQSIKSNKINTKKLLVIKILDTGLGMNSDVLKSIQKENRITLLSNNNKNTHNVNFNNESVGGVNKNVIYDYYNNSMGTGLGLGICKNLCSSLNIDLKIISCEGIGTIVTITFPVFYSESKKNKIMKVEAENSKVDDISQLKMRYTNTITNATNSKDVIENIKKIENNDIARVKINTPTNIISNKSICLDNCDINKHYLKRVNNIINSNDYSINSNNMKNSTKDQNLKRDFFDIYDIYKSSTILNSPKDIEIKRNYSNSNTSCKSSFNNISNVRLSRDNIRNIGFKSSKTECKNFNYPKRNYKREKTKIYDELNKLNTSNYKENTESDNSSSYSYLNKSKKLIKNKVHSENFGSMSTKKIKTNEYVNDLKNFNSYHESWSNSIISGSNMLKRLPPHSILHLNKDFLLNRNSINNQQSINLRNYYLSIPDINNISYNSKCYSVNVNDSNKIKKIDFMNSENSNESSISKFNNDSNYYNSDNINKHFHFKCSSFINSNYKSIKLEDRVRKINDTDTNKFIINSQLLNLKESVSCVFDIDKSTKRVYNNIKAMNKDITVPEENDKNTVKYASNQPLDIIVHNDKLKNYTTYVRRNTIFSTIIRKRLSNRYKIKYNKRKLVLGDEKETLINNRSIKYNTGCLVNNTKKGKFNKLIVINNNFNCK